MSASDGYRSSAREPGQAVAGSAAETGKPLFAGEYIAFSPFDRLALADLIRRAARPGCRMVEVGSWLGNGSTQVFLRELEQFPGAEFHCIDTWRGNANVQRHLDIVEQYDVFGTFLDNVARSESATKMTPTRMDSLAAAATFGSGSFDLVFIDADHSYEAVKADISAWQSKVKPGGILCGHDCELRTTPGNRPLLLANADRDVCEIEGGAFRHVHPGAILAVNEAFGGAVRLWAETLLNLADGTPGRSSIWWILRS
jgi:predicted O-methyltransferase YrrM